MTSSSDRRWGIYALAGAVVLSRWLLRAPVADDYDSFGFLLGMGREYDLTRFQPQFPGYPVYVGLGAALCRLGLAPLVAATAISALASGVTGLCLAICAERFAGRRAAYLVIGLHLVAWLPWLLGGGALSEGLAMAICAAACAMLVHGRFAASGFLCGLLLGTRASYWPLIGSLTAIALHSAKCQVGVPDTGVRHSHLTLTTGARRYRVLAGAGAGVLAWAVPFFLRVNPRQFVSLGLTHLAGHFGQWGGSVATRPVLLERGRDFLRGLFYDGLAPSPAALVGMALVLVVARYSPPGRIRRGERSESLPLPLGEAAPRGGAGEGSRARFPHRLAPLGSLSQRERRWLASLAVLLVPYALWVFFGQNIAEQPRHLLPLVEGGLFLLGCALAAFPVAGAVICMIVAAVSAPLAWQRHVLPPAAAQAADWVSQNQEPRRTTVAAGRSTRFFEALGADWTIRQHAALADVILDLARFDRLPTTILLTSEIDLSSDAAGELPDHWRTRPGPRFCRDPRIDRAQPCLSLTQLIWSAQ